MRRALPGAPRRRRALVLLLVAPAVSSAANTTALAPRSVPCGPASTSTANALTSQSCSDACGLNSLCVFRTHAPSACAVDCVPTEAAATTWTAKWLEDQPNGRAAVVVASAASSDDAESTVVIHDSVTRIADQLTLPTSIMHISLTGPTTSPLMKFSLSDDMRSSFASLRYLALTKVSVSDWKTLPTMPTLRNLSLNDVALDWWPNATSFDVLEALSLDNNPLPASLPTLPVTLRTLSLQSIGITELPSSLSNLTMLRNLFLGGNKIPMIATLNLPKSLQTLSMRNCALDSFPGNVELPPGLIALDLSDNPGIQLSTNTTALSGLRELRLAGCGIKTLSAVPPMNRELSILDLSSNPLADTDDTVSTQLAALPNLSSLDLSATDRRRVADAIATMAQLRHLSLASNKILTVDAATLPPSLQHLNIAFNDKAMALSVPPALLSLNVSNCGLTSLTPVVPLSKLESLDASGNALESNDLPPNVMPPTLTFLNLSNNRLTTFPTAVFELPSLQHLDLRGNPIPSGALASLSAAHVAFLNGLQSLYVDPSVFQSSDCGTSVATFSFGYTVCIIAASAADKRTNDPAAEAAAARARARINRNLTVIAITIGTALVLVTLTSLVMRRRRNRTRARALHSSKRDGMLLTGTAAQTDGAWPTELASDREMTDAEWRALQMWSFWDDEDVLQLRVPWDLVRDRQVIGSGQYSVLWLARVATQPVFLKALQPTAHRSDDLNDEGAVAAVAALMREIQVLRFVRHPQIVRLVGVTWLNSPTDVQLAIEDMANGDLRGYLELTQPPAPPSRWRSDGLAMRVALAIADALVFLHACGVAHNDLRSRNVVLDDDCHAKLTGFGRHVFVTPVEDEDEVQEHNLFVDAVARAAATAAQRDQHVPPPRVDHTFLIEAGRWMAPEVLRRHLRGRQRSLRSRSAASSTTTTTTTSATAAASPAADVYAFGVLLLELDAFEMPFERVELDVDVHEWRPRDDSTSDDDDAWEKRPHARDVAPSAASELRFSSMPSGHNSLLGGGATLLQPTMPSTPPPKFADDATAMGGGTTLLHAAEEKCELALLRRLADGAVQAEATPSCPTGVRDLIRQCMALRPESRPSMKVVRDALRAIASQRHRSSTGGSSANVNSNCTTVDSSRRGGGRGGYAVAAAQTGDEDRAGVAGSSSASSDATATTAFFVMHHTPTHRSVTPPM